MLLWHNLKNILNFHVARILPDSFFQAYFPFLCPVTLFMIFFFARLKICSFSFYIFFPCDFIYGIVSISFTHPLCILLLYSTLLHSLLLIPSFREQFHTELNNLENKTYLENKTSFVSVAAYKSSLFGAHKNHKIYTTVLKCVLILNDLKNELKFGSIPCSFNSLFKWQKSECFQRCI